FCIGRTTIVIAHRLTTIQNAHQIYVLDNGSVIEQGTHETLMEKEGGKYQSMLKRQQMERIDDDKHDMMSIQKAIEEEKKSIIERTCLLSNSQIVDVNKQNPKPFKQRFVFLRLLSMNSPEWITILFGCIACVLSGAAQPMSSSLASSVSGAKAFFDLFDRMPTIDNTSTKGQELDDFRGEITFDQIKFVYPTRSTSIILNKFQLNIKPNQRVALVGASGCGKSTIIQLLERFYDVTSGQLLLDGIDIRKLNLHCVRSHLGLHMA
ncbi:unnamed protein product, partial [Rotaria sp. Silwood1]